MAYILDGKYILFTWRIAKNLHSQPCFNVEFWISELIQTNQKANLAAVGIV